MPRDPPSVRPDEFETKVSRLREALSRSRKDAVVLDAGKNGTWLTGMRGYVNVATEASLARVVVPPDRVIALTSNNEFERLQEEEAAELPLVWDAYPWYGDAVREQKTEAAVRGLQAADEASLEPELVSLRSSLLPPELERARTYGPVVGQVIYEVTASLQDGMTENDVAGALSSRLMQEGFQPLVVLVAADQRCGLRPHPLPMALPIHHRALMAVSVMVPGGLVLSVTRQAVLGDPTDTEVAEHRALQGIFTAITSTAAADRRAPELWHAVRDAYAAHGFPGGYENHHQGGLAAYQSRETFLRPDSTWTIPERALVAFNPTGGSTKAEDTVAVDGKELVPVTLSADTPTEPVTAGGVTWNRPQLVVVR